MTLKTAFFAGAALLAGFALGSCNCGPTNCGDGYCGPSGVCTVLPEDAGTRCLIPCTSVTECETSQLCRCLYDCSGCTCQKYCL